MSEEEMYHYSTPNARVSAAPAAKSRRPLRAAVALVVAAAALACPASDADAANSPIGPSIGSGELSQQQILENLYGGSFTRSGDDFSNGQVDVERVSDEGGAEQIFQSEFGSARAVASFARNSQTFGTINDEGRFLPLFRTHRNTLDGAGPVDLRGSGLSNTILALQSGGATYAADPTLNPGGADQLVSYAVKSRGASPASSPDAFLLFWEDTASASSDYDYNDLVVEVSAAGGDPANVLIPLPAAAWSGLMVMAGVGIAAGIRRMRRR